MSEGVMLAIFGALFTLGLANLGVTLQVWGELWRLKTRMDNFEHPEGYHS